VETAESEMRTNKFLQKMDLYRIMSERHVSHTKHQLQNVLLTTCH